jgi:hypothetical protein
MRVENVYKSSDYRSNSSEQGAFSDIPSIDPNDVLTGALGGLYGNVFKGLGGDLNTLGGIGGRLAGLKNDVQEVCTAVTNFPFKSAFNIIGMLTVLYIGFNLARKFGMIKQK